MTAGMGDLNLPYEEGPAGQNVILGPDTLLASGVVIMAATVELAGQSTPCLVYRFANPDGSGFHPPFALVLGDHEVEPLITLTAAAARGALLRALEDRR